MDVRDFLGEVVAEVQIDRPGERDQGARDVAETAGQMECLDDVGFRARGREQGQRRNGACGRESGWPMKGATFVHQPLRPTASSVSRPSPLRGRLTASLRYTINHPATTTKHHATKFFCDIDHTTVARITQVRRRSMRSADVRIFHGYSIERRSLPSPMGRSGALCRPCDRPRNISPHLPGGRGAATRGNEARADLTRFSGEKGCPLSSPPG